MKTTVDKIWFCKGQRVPSNKYKENYERTFRCNHRFIRPIFNFEDTEPDAVCATCGMNLGKGKFRVNYGRP